MGTFQSGATLFITMLWLALTGFAEAPTTQIMVDQAGYLTSMPKLAMVAESGSNPPASAFSVRRSRDGVPVFEGRLQGPAFDPDSGDTVRIADFTSLKEDGLFYLEVAGVGRSWNFAIGPAAYQRVFYLAARAFYGQRCGIAVDLGPDYPQFKHGICHTSGQYDPSSGKEGPANSVKVWHDAGDYGRYVVTSGISTGTLLWTWMLYGDHIKEAGLNIPESGGAVPDLLSEVRWNLDWMLSMQDSDGGVYHKQTSAQFCGMIPPDADTLPSLVIGAGAPPFKTSCATADFAAVAALAARFFKSYDPGYAARCLTAAQKAWDWVERNPNVTFHNPKGITTGEYGDSDCGDEHLWAAAELWRATGKSVYNDYFAAHYRDYLADLRPTGPASWNMMAPFALWSYALGSSGDDEITQSIRERAVKAADDIAARAAEHPYRMSLTSKDYVWGSNGIAANYSLQLLVTDKIQPNAKYVAAALDNLHYLLGRNPFSLSWVTGVGEHPYQHPHHRPSMSSTTGEPWPGLLAGGANAGRQDDDMKRLLKPDIKPARCYIDVATAYACNEVAINWNAPLVFVLAAMMSNASAK